MKEAWVIKCYGKQYLVKCIIPSMQFFNFLFWESGMLGVEPNYDYIVLAKVKEKSTNDARL